MEGSQPTGTPLGTDQLGPGLLSRLIYGHAHFPCLIGGAGP